MMIVVACLSCKQNVRVRFSVPALNILVKTLVIARYNESLRWLEWVPSETTIIVVQKGGDLPNIGRESLSYLHYIVKNYDNLDGTYMFVQGNPLYHAPINFFMNKVPVFHGINYHTDENGGPYHVGLRVNEFFKEAGVYAKFPFTFQNGAQFTVSHKHLLSWPLVFYEKLMAMHLTWGDAPWIMERMWRWLFLSRFVRLGDLRNEKSPPHKPQHHSK